MSEISPTLRTAKLLLRPFLDSDLEDVFRGLSDPEVIRYYGVSYKSITETRAQMKWFKSLEEDRIGIWWGIYASDGKEFYGAVGLNNLNKEHRKAEIGFWLLPVYWGNA